MYTRSGSREKAYVHAITSAGVAYSITKACSRGELNECSCDNKIQRKQAKNNWQWGGCSEVLNNIFTSIIIIDEYNFCTYYIILFYRT